MCQQTPVSVGTCTPRWQPATIDELGGASNAGVTWLDLAATRQAVMDAMASMMGMLDPEGEFGAVHSSRYAPPRRTTNERAEQRVRAEHIGDGDGVGVEVEERAASLYRATEVPHVLEPEHAPDVVTAVG